MKKTAKTIIAVVTVMAEISLIFLSCEKELHNNGKPNANSSEAREVYEKIKRFQQVRDSYHANLKTGNEKITTEEARSLLDAVINYEFTDVTRFLTDTDIDTLYYMAPAADADGKVALSDLVELYDEFASDIESQRGSVNYFMVIYPQDGEKDNVKIVYTRGMYDPSNDSTSLAPYPFDEDDNWYACCDLGKCDGSVGYSDATQELTKKFPDTCNGYYQIIWDMEYLIVNYDSIPNNSGCSTYWLFYADSIPLDSLVCIPYYEMNCYWRSINRNVVLPSGIFHYSPILNSPYRTLTIGCKIDNIDYTNLVKLSHYAHIKYYKTGNVY